MRSFWLLVSAAVVVSGCKTPAPEPPVTPGPTPPPSERIAVVIDAGHGGTVKVGGSSPNNATSFSGVLEKKMTLDASLQVRDALKSRAASEGLPLDVHMTRTSDVNLGLADRADKARKTGAQVFVAIHFNAFNGVARGVETHIRPSSSNVNPTADRNLAKRIQNRAFAALKAHDSGAVDRGVKETSLAVLSDASLGNTSSSDARTRSCLVEIEFIDVEQVDRLLNIAPNPESVKRDIADAIARAILEDIQANL